MFCQHLTEKKPLFPDVTQPEDIDSEPKGDAGPDQDTVKPAETTEPETESPANLDVNHKQPEPSQSQEEEANTPEQNDDQDDTEEPANASQHESDSTEQTSAQTAQMKADDEEMQPSHSTPEGM